MRQKGLASPNKAKGVFCMSKKNKSNGTAKAMVKTTAEKPVKVAAEKPAKTMVEKTVKAAKPAKEKKPKRSSGLDAAAAVLKEQDKAMRCKDIVQVMLDKGMWKTAG